MACRRGVAGDGNTGQCCRRRAARNRHSNSVGRIRVQARGVDQAGDGGTSVAGRCDVFGHAGQCRVAAGDRRVVDCANRGAKRHRGSADGGGTTVVGCIGQVGADVACGHRGRTIDQAHCERAGYAVEVAHWNKAQAVRRSHQQRQCCSGTAHTGPTRAVVILPDALRAGVGCIAHNGDARQRVGAGATREGVGAVVEARRKEVADGVARHRASCDVFGYRGQCRGTRGHRCIVDRRDVDDKGLRSAGIDAAVEYATVVVDLHGDGGAAVGIGRWCVSQIAAGIDRRLAAEQRIVAVADDEVQGLT